MSYPYHSDTRSSIVVDKKVSQINIFLFLHEKMVWYALEAPWQDTCQGASNEYPQHKFSWRNKKNIISFHGETRKISIPSTF